MENRWIPTFPKSVEQVLETAPHKAVVVLPPTTHHKKLSNLDDSEMQDSAGKVGMNSKAAYSSGLLHMDDQLEPTYSNS